jgi:hypothetical protein
VFEGRKQVKTTTGNYYWFDNNIRSTSAALIQPKHYFTTSTTYFFVSAVARLPIVTLIYRVRASLRACNMLSTFAGDFGW